MSFECSFFDCALTSIFQPQSPDLRLCVVHVYRLHFGPMVCTHAIECRKREKKKRVYARDSTPTGILDRAVYGFKNLTQFLVDHLMFLGGRETAYFIDQTPELPRHSLGFAGEKEKRKRQLF